MATASNERAKQCSLSALTKFLIMADTHDSEIPHDTQSAFRYPLPSADVVLHCGDMTKHGELHGYARTIEMLSSVEAELKLVIPGNHDLSLDREFYTKQGAEKGVCDEAEQLWSSEETQRKGIVLLEEGTHTFTLSNGARFLLYASPYTPIFGESAFQIPANEDRFNPPNSVPSWAESKTTNSSIIPRDIDIVMTHGPPKYILDDAGDVSAGCEHLRRAIERTRPRLHCFGHIHGGWGARRGLWKKQKSTHVPGEKRKLAQVNDDDDEYDEDKSLEMLPTEFVGKNSCRRKGYASLSPGSADAIAENPKGQTLFVNAAIEASDDSLNAPWVVELQLPRDTPNNGRGEENKEAGEKWKGV